MLRVSGSGQGLVDSSAQEQERMRQTLQDIQRLDRPDEKGAERKIQSLNVYGEKNADAEVTVGSSTGEEKSEEERMRQLSEETRRLEQLKERQEEVEKRIHGLRLD